MAYIRRGGSGRVGSLRQVFNYYRRQMRNRLINEQAFNEAIGRGAIESRVYTLFKHLDYDEIYQNGITRKVGGKTVRFTGEDAILIQINALRERASKSYTTSNFIKNYLYACEEIGVSDGGLDTINKLLNSISIDKLTYLIKKGLLPDIQYLYAERLDEEELIEQIKNVIKTGVSKPELKEIQNRAKALRKNIKEKYDILGY